MFDHTKFQKYSFEDVPLDRDIFIVSEKWMKPYEEMMLRFFDGIPGSEHEHVGFVSWVSAKSTSPHTIELCWFPAAFRKSHEITIKLPRSEFVTCVGCWTADERPRIFVKDAWLDYIHLRNYSVFGLIDAIGIKQRIENASLTAELLLKLRQHIDDLASRYLDVSFVSFGDSLLLKSNWTVGMFDSDVTYTFKPEDFVYLFKEVSDIYQEVLGMHVYGIMTQGTNDFYGSSQLHYSASGNHVCMNCLGMPFERLFAIDDAARTAIRTKVHEASDLYLDEEYFSSLSLPYDYKHEFSNLKSCYSSKMSSHPQSYIRINHEDLIDILRRGKEQRE